MDSTLTEGSDRFASGDWEVSLLALYWRYDGMKMAKLRGLLPEPMRYRILICGANLAPRLAIESTTSGVLTCWRQGAVFASIVIAITAHFSGSRKIRLCKRVCRPYKPGEFMAYLLVAFVFALVGLIFVRIHDAVTSGLLGPR